MGVCTAVTPGTYSICSRTAWQTASAASAGSSPRAASAASAATSSGTAVVGVSDRNSARVSRSAGLRSVSHSPAVRGAGRSATSTRLSAVTTSCSCGASTSNTVTAVPQ
jgi:hypothetical protein